MQRRRFVMKAGGMLVAAGAAAVVDAPNVIAQPRVQWRMPSMWPPALDILQGNAQKFARIVDELTGGRFKIQVFAGGELSPDLRHLRACLFGRGVDNGARNNGRARRTRCSGHSLPSGGGLTAGGRGPAW